MIRRLAHQADRAHLREVPRVIVAHNPVGPLDDPSTSDVLAQVDLVAGALAGLGIETTRLPVAGWRIWEDLAAGAPPLAPGSLVFNLVEAPPGVPGVHPATAAALELLGLPFSGSSAASLWLTTDKLATRAVLAAEGLPVPAGGRLDESGAEVLDRVPPPWILKPAYEDASLGLDGDAVCATREAALARAAVLLRRFPGQPLVVEHYLPGRELNVSLLAATEAATAATMAPMAPMAPIALPVAEIEFVDYPAGMPRIVGYEAKWQPESFAYTHTVRRFPQDAASAPLLEQARRLAVAAWRACGLAGYGRVDLRLDERGVPHVLEVNANPCLAADAGFMAAAEQAGLGAAEVIARILGAAVERHRRLGASAHRPALAPAAEAAAGTGSRGRRASARRLRAVG
jgi:D-alanine-D-alanine ligase